jgi:CRISPR-associated protein Cas2
MRRCYLVCYDICHAKRLRRVFKVMKGYGEHWQFSVFFCVLKDIDRVRLQTDLEREMNLKEDQVMLLDLGPNEKEAREATTVLGHALPHVDSGMLVL